MSAAEDRQVSAWVWLSLRSRLTLRDAEGPTDNALACALGEATAATGTTIPRRRRAHVADELVNLMNQETA